MSKTEISKGSNLAVPSSKSQAPSEIFTDGLTQLLQPVVLETETRMKSVFQAQIQLEQQIDQLAKELDLFMEKSDQAVPSLVGPVQTLLRAKNRLIGINTTLMNIKDRLDRLEKQASSGTSSSTSRLPDVFSSFLGKIITTPSKGPEENKPASGEGQQVAEEGKTEGQTEQPQKQESKEESKQESQEETKQESKEESKQEETQNQETKTE